MKNFENKAFDSDLQQTDIMHLIHESEDVIVVTEGLAQVRQWLAENPAINGKRDTITLLNFFRSCKHDLERTKQKITSFYLMRSIRTEWFHNRDPFLPEIQELLKIGVFLPLDEKDELNRQIVIIRTSAHNPKKHSQNNVLKVSKMILDILLQFQPEMSLHGLVAIFDMNKVQLGHALQMTPTLIKRSVDSWQVYPTKPKQLEFVNVPNHVNIILNTFKLFMNAKMKSRVIVRRSTSEAKVALPKELGGTGPSYEELAVKWKTIVEENSAFFIEDEKYKTVN